MKEKRFPLKEVSVGDLFINGDKSSYEIPIYQRNYAWEKDEITTLIQDVYDACRKGHCTTYFIGTLVSFWRGDSVFEIIDGQQRLTTIYLVLRALAENNNSITLQNKLTYRARAKSDATLKAIPHFDLEEKDAGIENGYKYARTAIKEIIAEDELREFTRFFTQNVHIIHYQVPRDIDLNHYFEVMNSRGEQLEKHEIVKAFLMEKLRPEESSVFYEIWEACSNLSVYVQQNMNLIPAEKVFGANLDAFLPADFSYLCSLIEKEDSDEKLPKKKELTIRSILQSDFSAGAGISAKNNLKKDSFQPIIDFSNFLLIVLKIFLMDNSEFRPAEFNLDDKELLNEFKGAGFNSEQVRKFAFLLLKARYYLDNFVVHHSKEEDTLESNPWKLQTWHKDSETKKAQLRNTCTGSSQLFQDRLVQLLSMFEVSFTARQRKNYLFYCLFYLIKNGPDLAAYTQFAEELADRYFFLVYMDETKLNAINTPLPGSFDEIVLKAGQLDRQPVPEKDYVTFVKVFGDGSSASRGVPLFVFNYLDYKLWKLYETSCKGKEYKKDAAERKLFFDTLGCSDFELKVFDQFYFSRTRRSLEHYYPQANATGEPGTLDRNQINCFGNYSMIGSEANSAGSNWSPLTKLNHYLDSSRKISLLSVASLKFMIMMQTCRDRQQWEFKEIKEHQERMFSILAPFDNKNKSFLENMKQEETL